MSEIHLPFSLTRYSDQSGKKGKTMTNKTVVQNETYYVKPYTIRCCFTAT